VTLPVAKVVHLDRDRHSAMQPSSGLETRRPGTPRQDVRTPPNLWERGASGQIETCLPPRIEDSRPRDSSPSPRRRRRDFRRRAESSRACGMFTLPIKRAHASLRPADTSQGGTTWARSRSGPRRSISRRLASRATNSELDGYTIGSEFRVALPLPIRARAVVSSKRNAGGEAP